MMIRRMGKKKINDSKENEKKVTDKKDGDGSILDNVKDKIVEVVKDNKDEIIKTICSKMGLTAEQGKQMMSVLEMFDNGNGEVKKEQIGDIVRSMNKNPTDDEINEIEKELKFDKNGNIKFTEFVQVVGKKFPMEDEREKTLREAFKVFDKDANGFLSKEEIKDIMTNKGKMRLSVDEVEEMIAEVDKNRDGKLNYEEFIVLFSQ